MNYISGYVWGGKDALLLQQIRMKKVPICFACISEDLCPLDQGETVGGYLTRSLLSWFSDRGRHLCSITQDDKQIKAELHRQLILIQQELDDFGEKKRRKLFGSVTGILMAGTSFWMFHKGESRIYLLNQRFYQPHVRLLAGTDKRIIDQIPDLEINSGNLQGGLGILLCTSKWYDAIKEEQFRECLDMKEVIQDTQIEKRLKELTQSAGYPNQTIDGSAVLVKTIAS